MNLIQDVNSLFEMFNMDVYSFVDKSNIEKETSMNKIKGESFDQFQEICQGGIDEEYMKWLIFTQGVDHILLLKVKNLVISMAILNEKKNDASNTYMDIEILCARKQSSMGKQMILASENYALRKGITFTSLSSLPSAMMFYDRMGYKSITPNQACKAPSHDDTLVLDVYKESKRLLDLPRQSSFSDYMQRSESKVSTVLRNLQVSEEDISYLNQVHGDIFDIMNNRLNNIDIEKHFDSGNLVMSKCLVDGSTIDIFNIGM